MRTVCRVLEVSCSGYYNWTSEERKSKAQRRYDLLRAIEKIHLGSRGTYGSPRVYPLLKALGFKVSKASVERVMREYGIRGKKKRRFVTTTDSKHKYPVALNIVDRNFDQGSVNKVWLQDITYLRTKEGWAYLATVMDGHSRKIMGWSIADSLEATIAVDALEMAVKRERPKTGVLAHSDRGVQYACSEFRQALQRHCFTQSMSRRGNCWDNAPMESFFDTLKCEHVSSKIFENVDEARQSIFEWIEVFYNRIRIHSSLGYKSPTCVHESSMAKAS